MNHPSSSDLLRTHKTVTAPRTWNKNTLECPAVEREQRKTPEIKKHKWEDDDNGRRVLKESYRVTRRPPQYLQGYYWPGRLGMAPGHYRALFTGLQGAWNKMQEKKVSSKRKGKFGQCCLCGEFSGFSPNSSNLHT